MHRDYLSLDDGVLVEEFLLEGLHLKGIFGNDLVSGKWNSSEGGWGLKEVDKFHLLLNWERVDELLFSSDELSFVQQFDLLKDFHLLLDWEEREKIGRAHV